VTWRGPRFERLCAGLATGCIELLTGADRQGLRRCEGPGCSLLFVQQHGRRRFCHESCSHRDRQQRYARRVATTTSKP
jgi:predicted RNA-binding Zn ribbon-like protein